MPPVSSSRLPQLPLSLPLPLKQRTLEQQAADSRRDASTMEEQVRRNPNGILARFERERKQKEEATKKNL